MPCQGRPFDTTPLPRNYPSEKGGFCPVVPRRTVLGVVYLSFQWLKLIGCVVQLQGPTPPETTQSLASRGSCLRAQVLARGRLFKLPNRSPNPWFQTTHW